MDGIAIFFLLFVIFQIKHFLADYPLQTEYMLGKFKPGWDFLGPLLAHAGVHGIMTTLICGFFDPSFWWLGPLDAAIHFTMDRIKASPKLLGRYKALSGAEFVALAEKEKAVNAETSAMLATKPHFYEVMSALQSGNIVLGEIKAKRRGNTYFWWALGFDQMVHHLTHYLCIYLLVRG